MLSFDDVGCDYGERLEVVCSDGSRFSGMFVDLEIDFDGSYGGDSVSLRLDDGHYMSFIEHDIVRMGPVVQASENPDSISGKGFS